VTNTDDNGNGPKTNAETVSSRWSDADRRALIITVAGTLVANLGTVLLVAGAIILARFLNKHPYLIGKNFTGDYSVGFIFATVMVGVTYYTRRRHRDDRGESIFFWIFTLIWIFLLIGLVGYAASVSSH
jgi:hypothetical protein